MKKALKVIAESLLIILGMIIGFGFYRKVTKKNIPGVDIDGEITKNKKENLKYEESKKQNVKSIDSMSADDVDAFIRKHIGK